MNQEKIVKIKEAILRSNDVLEELADLYKVFGDSTRVKILTALTQSEMCVSEISEFLEITQSAVSHQLRVLKTSGLVKIKRSGKNIYYSLADEHVGAIIDCGMEHLLGE
ncbi:MAG: winged helix-turn-helix transcriptional regulator [Clostridia bacterium]|nr:winged helix-turn-helix transcriptional regulator [Clostridia bacterium]